MNIKVEFSDASAEVIAGAFYAIAESLENGGLKSETAGTQVIGIGEGKTAATVSKTAATPPVKTAPAKTTPPKTPAVVTPPVEEAAPEETDEENVDFGAEEDYTPTKTELKSLIAQKAVKEKKREAVGAILASVSATNVDNIGEAYYASVYAQLNAL